jgi:sugar/nucleoside kinase (ribokinase family)
LCAADLPASLLEGCAALHVSGHTLLAPPGSRAAARGLMRAARSRGIPVSVDAASPAPLRAAGREAFLAWTEDAATCFCNEAEAAILCGDGLRFACLIVTRGGAGADVIAGGTRVTAGAAAAIVRDTTGAGDAFTAAALLGMRRNLPLSQWLADALSAGARAVGLTGARPPLPGGPG